MSFSEMLLDHYLITLKADGRSEHTIRAYRSDIKDFLSEYESEEKDPEWFRTAIPEYMAAIRGLGELAPSTIKRKATSLRSFGRWVLADDSFMSKYKAPIVAPGRAHPLPGGMDDVARMVQTAYKPHHKALIALCGRLGLRVEEARRVTVRHFSDDDGIVLSVYGKGSKMRDIPVSLTAMIDLTPAYTMASQTESGLLVPISDRAARRAITRTARRAGISRPVSSHDLRHTFATVTYDRTGHDIRTVQELLGHASVETTQVYTGVSMARKRAALDD